MLDIGRTEGTGRFWRLEDRRGRLMVARKGSCVAKSGFFWSHKRL